MTKLSGGCPCGVMVKMTDYGMIYTPNFCAKKIVHLILK